MHGIHVLSYVTSDEDPWPAGEFTRQEVGVSATESVTVDVAERGVCMADGPWLSELRWHSGNEQQMAVISSDHALDMQRIAGNLHLEFTSARFLRYQRDNQTLDRLCRDVSRILSQPNEQEGGQHCRWDSADANVFLDAVKRIAFRAQEMLIQALYEREPELGDVDGVLRSIFESSVDLISDMNNKTLVVLLRPPNNNGHAQIYQSLCATLTATETLFPGTDLRLIYEWSFLAR